MKRHKPTTISPEFVATELGGLSLSGLSRADKDSNRNYFILPNYPRHRGEVDVKLTRNHYQMWETTRLITKRTPPSAAGNDLGSPITRVSIRSSQASAASALETLTPVASAVSVRVAVAGAPRKRAATTDVAAVPKKKTRVTITPPQESGTNNDNVIKMLTNIAKGYQNKAKEAALPAEAQQTRKLPYKKMTSQHGGMNRLSVQSKRYFRWEYILLILLTCTLYFH